ncbi:serine hydrolase domain-containing protein [Mesorhizobium xinjiangense]|uniref:serine hydrolase domain-containing protein n=1 Tax=Mesorhizobium xinjiangense TaxID=2678685 RepID=UPI0012ED72E1|nr:serine hydrolase [Mesorhizobium xinjiangense]
MTTELPPRTSITLANWRTHPSSRWSFQNVGEFVPSARFAEPVGEEPGSPGASSLHDLAVMSSGGEQVPAADYLEQSFGDAFVAMREGRIVAEWHAPHCAAARPHVVFSISKSITGMLAGIAHGEGLLDPDAPVAQYVEVEPGSAYSQARVRDLLDMTVSLEFEEDYLNRDGPFDRYRRAMLWNPERAGTTPETLAAVLASLPRAPGNHGERFYYASPNTDMLGLVVERATGRRYHAYLGEKLWGAMGARGAGEVTIDREGTARAAGGVCVTARDLARLGQLVMENGRGPDGAQVIPAAWIDDMRSNGDRKAWTTGNFADVFADGRYRSCWYSVGDADGCLAAVGIHGQWIWINPRRGVVLVKFSSRPEPSDDAATQQEIAALRQIAVTI